MLHLETVAIAGGFQPGVSHSVLELIPIADAKVTGVETEGDRQGEPVLSNAAARKRLHADVQIVWGHSQILAEPERKSHADTFINRMRDITAQPQRTEHVEINHLRHRHRDLDISPLLVIGLIQLRARHTAKNQNYKANARGFFQFVPFGD